MKPDGQNLVIQKWMLPESLVFRPLVKGNEDSGNEIVKAIEKFVCELYVPKTSLSTMKDLRWWLFRKKLAQSEGQSRDSYY